MGSPHDFLERCNSLAIMGGTFDPIHLGHIAIAEAVLQQFKPQRVLFIPSGQPPHRNATSATAEDRYQMVLTAICHNPWFDVSRLEINRTGNSYTFDTVKELKSICPPTAKISFVIGADAFLEIESWRNVAELFGICNFITIPRPGSSLKELNDHIKLLKEKYNARIDLLEVPQLEISGTNIRNRLLKGESVIGLMPRLSEDYIRQNGLYNTVVPDLGINHFKWAKAKLKSNMSPRRFKHTLGVIEEAEKLAIHYNQDENKAKWAALLHDCTKEYSTGKKHALCKLWNIPLDPILENQIDLTHGQLGAESARRDYYVNDEEILYAIRYHTMGVKKMSELDKIVILADFIDPYREDYKPLKEMRKLAYKSMDKALEIGTQYTIDTLNNKGSQVHRWNLEALQTFKKAQKSKEV